MCQSRLIIAFIALVFGISAARAQDYDQAEYDAVTQFILDVTSFEGMIHSVFDYCGSRAKSPIVEVAQQQWTRTNQKLLDDRQRAEQIYLGMMDGPEQAAEAAARLEAGLKTLFDNQRLNDRLVKDLVDVEDQASACAKRLGVMNSDSMSFARIAPESFAYWQARFAD